MASQYIYIESSKPWIIPHWFIYFWQQNLQTSLFFSCDDVISMQISIKCSYSLQVSRRSTNLITSSAALELLERFGAHWSLSKFFRGPAWLFRFMLLCLSQRNCKQFVLMFALFNLDLLRPKSSIVENGHST